MPDPQPVSRAAVCGAVCAALAWAVFLACFVVVSTWPGHFYRPGRSDDWSYSVLLALLLAFALWAAGCALGLAGLLSGRRDKLLAWLALALGAVLPLVAIFRFPWLK